ncbi:hypothetical protein ABCR94_17750 [Streptomyces sp. 21So2-11]|uniref:hypothetical protein n=1 Tax=Streptomyces sp. 21So2-11 TaxID=3144408 RepID=UPI00321BCACC
MNEVAGSARGRGGLEAVVDGVGMDDDQVLEIHEPGSAGGRDEQPERIGEVPVLPALPSGNEQNAVLGEELVGAVKEAGPAVVDCSWSGGAAR